MALRIKAFTQSLWHTNQLSHDRGNHSLPQCCCYKNFAILQQHAVCEHAMVWCFALGRQISNYINYTRWYYIICVYIYMYIFTVLPSKPIAITYHYISLSIWNSSLRWGALHCGTTKIGFAFQQDLAENATFRPWVSHRENGGTLRMVPLIINPIYTLF